MSPSSRGIVPGLFLALAAAFAILTLNSHWLLPAVDDDGMAYLVAAPQLAAGQAPDIPLVTWDAADPTTGLEDRGTAMPLTMAALMGTGRRAYVTALWLLAVSAGLAVLTAAWVGGGVAGIPGALAAGLALAASPLMIEAVTAIRPEVLVMAMVGLQLGLMTYRPRWSVLHGIPAAVAWLAHPVGLGAVAAALVWPLREKRDPRSLGAAALAAIPSIGLLATGSVMHGTLVPPGLSGPSAAGAWSAAVGILRWAGTGLGGFIGPVFGLVVAVAILGLVLADLLGTQDPPPDVHWSDPAAADALAMHLRPAAGILVLALGAAAVLTAGSGSGFAQPWAPMALPLTVLAASSAIRRGQGRSGAKSLVPVAVLVAWLSMSSVNAVLTFRTIRAEGRGHTAAVWVASEVIRWVDNRSAPYPLLYASEPALILLQSGRSARGIPSPGANRADFVESFRAHPGPIVLSGTARDQAESLAAELGMVQAVTTEEGIILIPDPSQESPRR